MTVIEREPDDSGGPACDCGSTAVIDANRHDWRCARRLWVEREEARTELRGAVDAIRDVRRAALVGLTANDQTARLYKGALARVVEITDDALKGQ